jgi:hypothetical protein
MAFFAWTMSFAYLATSNLGQTDIENQITELLLNTNI